MRTLILFRHAKAEPADNVEKDIDRHLAPRGLTDAPKVAKALVEAGLGVDLALVSTAQRTQETWYVIAPQFEGAQVKSLAALYDAEAEDVWRLVQEQNDAQRLIVVGHNPFMHDLAVKILRHCKDKIAKKVRRELIHLPTSGAVAFEFPDGPFKLEQAACLGFWQAH
ncbi:MAG: histidine phosphatase family protein [Caulobacterales bacterium]